LSLLAWDTGKGNYKILASRAILEQHGSEKRRKRRRKSRGQLYGSLVCYTLPYNLHEIIYGKA
jgi:hypothetical protein